MNFFEFDNCVDHTVPVENCAYTRVVQLNQQDEDDLPF